MTIPTLELIPVHELTATLELEADRAMARKGVSLAEALVASVQLTAKLAIRDGQSPEDVAAMVYAVTEALERKT